MTKPIEIVTGDKVLVLPATMKQVLWRALLGGVEDVDLTPSINLHIEVSDDHLVVMTVSRLEYTVMEIEVTPRHLQYILENHDV